MNPTTLFAKDKINEKHKREMNLGRSSKVDAFHNFDITAPHDLYTLGPLKLGSLLKVCKKIGMSMIHLYSVGITGQPNFSRKL